MQRYAAGQSIREISRKEGRARETITKIVRCDEMQAHVQQMRERFYGLGCEALGAVEHPDLKLDVAVNSQINRKYRRNTSY
jgi:hypothetical protein